MKDIPTGGCIDMALEQGNASLLHPEMKGRAKVSDLLFLIHTINESKQIKNFRVE